MSPYLKNKLQERYGRKDVLINAHMNKLLRILPLKQSNDSKSLGRIYDQIQIHMTLGSLDIRVDTYGNLACPVLKLLLPRFC